MPAQYGPGCPTKYQSHRKYGTRRTTQRFKRNDAAANVALTNYVRYLDGDALDVEQAVGSMASWPVKVGTATQPGAQKPIYEEATWAPDGGPCVAFDAVGVAFIGPTGVAAGEQTAWTLSAAQTNAVVGSILFESSANTNLNNGFSQGVNAAAERNSTAHQVAPNTYNAKSSAISDGAEFIVTLTAIDMAQPAVDETDIWVNGVRRALTTTVNDDLTTTFDAGLTSYMGSRNNGAAAPWDGLCRVLVSGSGVLTDEQKLSLSSIAMYKARVL
jgi:hypothetical protein